MRRGNPAAGFVLLLSVLCIGGYAASIRVPIVVQKHVKDIFATAGFDAASLKTAKSGINTLIYEDIKLDPKGFSTLKTLKITYSPIALMLSSQIEAIEIDGLNVTGEIDKNGRLSLAGWGANASPETKTLIAHMFAVQNMTFKNVQASILSANHGGISIQLEGETVRENDGIYLQGKLENTQKEMRYTANITGKITTNESWQADIELADIRLNTQAIKATRASGQVSVTNDASISPTISGEIRAGNMNLIGFPWATSSIALRGSPTQPGVIIAAKAAGYEGVELGLSLSDIRNTNELSGYIFAESLDKLLGYLEEHDALSFDRETFAPISDLKNVEIAFDKKNDLLEITSLKSQSGEEFSGLLQIRNVNGENKLLNAALENVNMGGLSINNPEFFALLDVSASEKAKIRRALSNVRYDQMLLEVKNVENEIHTFVFKIRGSNPDLENARPFKMELTFKSKLEPLLKILLKD